MKKVGAASVGSGHEGNTTHSHERTGKNRTLLVPDLSPAVASNVTAGLALAARSLAAANASDLSLPTATQIVAAAGATRSRAYELRDAIMGVLPKLVRGPGRPKAQREPVPDGVLADLRGELLRFVMQHPGCVHAHPGRSRYAESFRHFVLELRDRHADLSLADFAAAVLVPVGTLEDWLRPGRAAVPTEATPHLGVTESETAEPDARQAHIQTVLAQWRSWGGDFGSFCEHVGEHHRVPFGRSLIADILFAHGERTPRRRAGRCRDEEALRGSFETFFPGAQWVGDGKQLAIVIDGETLHQNLELCVDAYSGAAVGIDVRDEEDSPAVVVAFEDGVHTTGEPPLALLLDNKPCNHNDEVDAALGHTLRLRSTLGRAQNKAHVEGAFGLFSQTVPPIELRTGDPRQLARDVARLVATVFFCVLNRRPRLDRNGRSRLQLYDKTVTDAEREAALASLKERLRKQQLTAHTLAARADPAMRALLDDAFTRLELDDPERHFRNAIACYPLDTVVDAISIFDGKRSAATLPDRVDARYLLGIVKNVHHCHEAEAITAAMLRERLAARDQLLEPLVRERAAILAETGTNIASVLDAIVRRLTEAERIIDRHFWLDAAAAVFPDDDEHRRQLFTRVARRIHAAFRLQRDDRCALERSLLRRLWPLT